MIEQTVVRIYNIDGTLKADIFILEDPKQIITLATILDNVKLKILNMERARIGKELKKEASIVASIRKLLLHDGIKSETLKDTQFIIDNLIQTEEIGSHLFVTMLRLNKKLIKLPLEDKKRLLKDVTSTIENVIGGG